MSEQGRRIGLNEALFREVNERMRALNEAFTELGERMDFICECASPSCTEHVTMTREEYEAVRADRRHFLVLPGHALGDGVERVVEKNEGFDVVEKVGASGEVAEETDLR